jgi:hypothetical protein
MQLPLRRRAAELPAAGELGFAQSGPCRPLCAVSHADTVSLRRAAGRWIPLPAARILEHGADESNHLGARYEATLEHGADEHKEHHQRRHSTTEVQCRRASPQRRGITAQQPRPPKIQESSDTLARMFFF